MIAMLAVLLLTMPGADAASLAAATSADSTSFCRQGMTASERALLDATTARTRPGRVAVFPSTSLFRNGQRSGCARMRFAIDTNGHPQSITIERFHPNPLFARAILHLLRSMEFEPRENASDALVVIALRLDDAPEEPAPESAAD